jgi:exosortase/archaeosortase family protein
VSGPAGKRAARRAPRPGRRAPRQILIGFVIRFAVGWIVSVLLLTRAPRLERLAVETTVAQLTGTARVLGFSATGVGNRVLVEGVPLRIGPDCTPTLPIVTLWLAVLTFPATWRMRILGLALSATLLWIYNLARILALLPVLRWKPGWFSVAHSYLWQTATLLAILGIFILWLRMQRPRPAA